jgi:hypothetical protein
VCSEPCLEGVEGCLLVRVEYVGSPGRESIAGNRLQGEPGQFPPSQGAGRDAGLRYRFLQRGEVMLAGMQLQVCQQLALVLG